jgi:prepilin-type N-terminal cleavage/methylation domain-containing protein
MTRKQKGFSLIELLIVVAIILIIAAIAIPNLLRAKMAANESSSVGSLRSINTANVSYASNYPSIGFSPTMAALGGVSPCTTAITTAACLIDDTLATAITAGTAKSGYFFTYAVTQSSGLDTGYTNLGTPANQGVTGQRNFFTDESGVIRYGLTGAATVASSPIQ